MFISISIFPAASAPATRDKNNTPSSKMLSNAKHWPETVHTLPCINSTAFPSCRPPYVRHESTNAAIGVLVGQPCFTPLCCTYTLSALSTRLLTPHDESSPSSALNITCSRQRTHVIGTGPDSSDRVASKRPMRTILACGQCLKALVVSFSSWTCRSTHPLDLQHLLPRRVYRYKVLWIKTLWIKVLWIIALTKVLSEIAGTKIFVVKITVKSIVLKLQWNLGNKNIWSWPSGWNFLGSEHNQPKLLTFPEILETEHPGTCWPQYASGGDSADSTVPLLVSRFLTGDDRYVMSCPVTFLMAERGRPAKTSYFSAKIASLNFLTSKLLNTEVSLYLQFLSFSQDNDFYSWTKSLSNQNF